jgi:hypothetical protein
MFLTIFIITLFEKKVLSFKELGGKRGKTMGVVVKISSKGRVVKLLENGW